MSLDKKDVLSKADIVSIIGTRITLKKEGNNYVGLCPFHNELSASFKVSPSKKIFKCFGCGRSGDVLAFVEQFDCVDFAEAVRKVGEASGILDLDTKEQEIVYELPDERDTEPGPGWLSFFNDRGISPRTVEELGITESVEYIVENKRKASVICFNYYKGSQLRNIKFRTLDKKMQLCKNAELLPYNIDAIRDTTDVCITEGEIDTATLVECQIRNSVSVPNGAGGINLSWIGKWFDKKEKIILFTDDDEAGKKLRDRLVRRLGYHRCFFVTYPEGCKDINDVLVKHGKEAVISVRTNCYAATLPVIAEKDVLVAPEIDPDLSLTIAILLANGKFSYKINIPGILHWARSLGFAWIKYSDVEGSPVMLVRLADNIIYPVTDQDVVHEYLKEVDLNYSQNEIERGKLYEFAKSLKNELAALPYSDTEILRDSRLISYLCFTNGIVAVNKDTAEFMRYDQAPGAVFSRYIIPHEYHVSESTGNFYDFITAISMDLDHTMSILSYLGYMLHSFKLRTEAKAVVIVEDVEDESEAKGRSGKGLLAQFIELFKNTVQLDGRNYKGEDKFKLQRVDISTQLLYLNDPPPKLLVNQFYNLITDDFVVEAKGLKSYNIPFKRSPKILITTNHLPPLNSDSDRERFALLTIKKTFGAKEQISHRFPGVLFFDADHWPKKEFDACFQLAIEAIQIWLTGGLVSYSTPEMDANKSKRAVATQVPEGLVEMIDQAVAIRKELDSENLFNEAIRNIDLSEYRNILNFVIKYDVNGIDIWLTPLYMYCIRILRVNGSQRWFGRQFRFYLQENKLSFIERRSTTSGYKITIYTQNITSSIDF